MKKKYYYTALVVFSLLAAGIQPARAIDIPGDVSVGTWDPVDRIYTLTTDVTEGLVIMEDNLTLDGNGKTVSGVSPGAGVKASSKYHVTIKNLIVTGCDYGIWLVGPNLWGFDTYNNVTDNTVSGCAYGISLTRSDYNEVAGNTLSACGHAIGLGYSDYNTVTGNTVNGSTGNGIGVNDSAYNTVTGNTVNGGTGDAINLNRSSYNDIYNNNFISNTTQARVFGGSDNVFDVDGSGNYWSDYTGEDTNGDGIGDTEIPHLGLDNYPFIVGNGWSNDPPIADAGPDQTVDQDSPAGADVTLDGSGSSDDPIQPLTYMWQWDSGSASGVNPTVTLPVGTTQVILTVSDGVLSDTDTVEIAVQSTEPPGQTPQEIVQDIIDYIVEDMYVPPEAEKEVGKAVKELKKAIKELNKGKTDKAIKKIEKAIKQLEKAYKKGADTQDVIEDLYDLMEAL
ncbi:MAG: NosD domain-containing protein [Planctomycetota bacterium]